MRHNLLIFFFYFFFYLCLCDIRDRLRHRATDSYFVRLKPCCGALFCDSFPVIGALFFRRYALAVGPVIDDLPAA